MSRPTLRLPQQRRNLRPSGVDRQAYADVVSEAFAEERIDSAGLEWRNEKVWSLKTIGELDDMVSDLIESPAALPQPTTPVVRTARTVRPAKVVIVAILVAVLIGGIAGIVAIVGAIAGAIGGDGITGSGTDGQIDDVEMFTADGLQRVVDDLVTAADGRTDFSWFGLYAEYAIATGPGAEGATRMARYDWRDGDVDVEPNGEALDDPENTLFDITTDLDLPALAALAASAPQRTGVGDPDSVYLFVSRSTWSADHQIEVYVSISNEYEDGRITADQNGVIISAEGPSIEDDPERFLRADGIQDAFDAVETRIGGTEITEIAFYGGYVITEAPPEPGADVVDSFDYRGGLTAYRSGPASSQPDDLSKVLFDLDDIDPAQMAADITEAKRLVNIRDATSSYAYIERGTGRGAGGGIQISVYLSGPYDSGYVVFDVDGNVLSTS